MLKGGKNKEIFDFWNEKKKHTNLNGVYPHFLSGQIWWTQLGKNIATEIDGKGSDFLRPVLILQRVYGNACIAIPLTSQEKIGNYYFTFSDSKGKTQCAILAQARYIDGKRLKYQCSIAKSKDFNNLKNSFCSLIKK